MGKYEVCWPMGRIPTGRAPHQLTESPFKYLKLATCSLGKVAIGFNNNVMRKNMFCLIQRTTIKIALVLSLQLSEFFCSKY